MILLVLMLLFALGAGVVFAQENPEEMARKYNIQFPIAELGSCASFSACKAYCDNEANQDTCVAFAKKKGFYQEAPRGNSTALLQEAKRELGCDSESSCRAVCENPQNQQKCSEFAKQTGLGGGVRQVGPGGCNSEESCRAYCESHRDECMKFGGQSPQSSNTDRKGPGGCDSEESCRTYCQSHPEECGGQGNSGPQEEREKFCQDNPDKCAQGQNGPSNMNPEEFCRQNPDKCQPPTDSYRQDTGSYQEQPDHDANQYQYQRPPENYTSPDQSAETNTQTGQLVQGVATQQSFWQKILDFFL